MALKDNWSSHVKIYWVLNTPDLLKWSHRWTPHLKALLNMHGTKSLENNNIAWTIATITCDVSSKGLEFLSRHGMQGLSRAFWKCFKEVPEKLSTGYCLLVQHQVLTWQSLCRQGFTAEEGGCELIDRTLPPTGRSPKEKQKLTRRALCVAGSPVAVASAHGARWTEPLAVSPFPSSPGQALWCFLVCPLLLPLQKLEDGWACISHTHVNLRAATFQIWCLSLKCSGLTTLKFLPPKDFFSCSLSFQGPIHFP